MKNFKCTFVIPYFGSFPNYFPLFLKSCGYNRDYSWIIVTDNTNDYIYPENVKVLQMSFENFKNRIERKLNIKVDIRDYHKICDFKPTYGYIFEEELKKSKFWGFCDMDLVFGDLNSFISDDMLDTYDKIFCLGHLTMFRNTFEINREFMKPLNGNVIYKKVLSLPDTYVFDEPVGIGNGRCVHDIFIENNRRIFSEDFSLNLKIEPSNIVQVKFNYENNKQWTIINHKNDVCLWNKGKIELFSKESGVLKKVEYLYMHFQSRDMKFDDRLLKKDCYKILGDGFYELEYPEVTIDNFSKIKKSIISLRYLKIKLKYKINGLHKKLSFKKYINRGELYNGKS